MVLAKPSVGIEVMRRLKKLLQAHGYAAGTKLPSERDLALELGVSRQSVREAVKTLTLMGVIESRQGSRSQISSSGANILRIPFEFFLLIEQPSTHDVFEVRELIELHLATRAARHRTDEDLIAIQNAWNDMADHGDNDAEPDVRFHEAIARASHNRVLEAIISSLAEGVRLCIDETRPLWEDWSASLDVHLRILDAIRAGDELGSRQAMQDHMNLASDELAKTNRNSRS